MREYVSCTPNIYKHIHIHTGAIPYPWQVYSQACMCVCLCVEWLTLQHIANQWLCIRLCIVVFCCSLAPINFYPYVFGLVHGPLTRYVKLCVAHVPGMPETLSPPPRVSDPDIHHGTCVTPVSLCMPGLLTGGILWSRRRGKRSRHSRCMHNPQFYVSGKRTMALR